MQRWFQKMALAVLIFSEGFDKTNLLRMHFRHLKAELVLRDKPIDWFWGEQIRIIFGYL